MICEEAAFIHPTTFYNIIVPLLTVSATAWLNISTVSTERNNHFTDLLKNDFIKSLEVSLACDKCKREGKTAACEHRKHEIPPWSDDYSRKVVEKIYGEHHKEQFLRETMGVDEEAGPECFNAKRVDALFLEPRVPLPSQAISHIFVAIDPCAGSQDREKAGSDYGVVSICGPGTLILGAEALDVCDPDCGYEECVLEHFRRLFAIPQMQQAIAIVAFESNSGHHYALSKQIQHAFPSRIVLMGDKDLRKGGVTTTNKTKQAMMEVTQAALLKKDMHVAKEFVTTHAKPGALMEQFRAQMLRYREHRKPSDTPFGKDQVAWSGKSGNMKDDLAVTLQLALYWRERFWGDPTYRAHHV